VLDRPLETADGLLVMSAHRDDRREALSRVCGEGSATTVAELLRGRPAAWWEEALLGAGVPATKVTTDLSAVAHDRRLAPLLEPAGGCLVPSAPWRFAR
jgi:hypothetical protein